jgi:hypothetical protein
VIPSILLHEPIIAGFLFESHIARRVMPVLLPTALISVLFTHSRREPVEPRVAFSGRDDFILLNAGILQQELHGVPVFPLR